MNPNTNPTAKNKGGKVKRKRKQRTFDPGPDAFIILLLSTSAGEHTVVATVPAAKLAVKWQRMLSSNMWVLRSSALKKSYLNGGCQRSLPNWIAEKEASEAGRRKQKEASRSQLTSVHQHSSEHVWTDTTA